MVILWWRRIEVSAMEVETGIDRLPIDLLSHIFLCITSFTDLAQASCVCNQWSKAVKQSIGRRENFSFSGWKMNDESPQRIVSLAFNLKELDISRRRWGCQITDAGLNKISMAKFVPNLTSVSLWGMTGITDIGVIQLVSRADSLRHLNVGGTFITDESLFAIANNCSNLQYCDVELSPCDRGWTRLPGEKMQETWIHKRMGNSIFIPVNCFLQILEISPILQIKPNNAIQHNQHQILMWPLQ